MTAGRDKDLVVIPQDDLIIYAWTIIANGITHDADPRWVEAAFKWRDQFHKWLETRSFSDLDLEDDVDEFMVIDPMEDGEFRVTVDGDLYRV